MTRHTLRRAIAISLIATLAIASFLIGKKLWKDVEKNTYSAYFSEANGLFVGDEIRILGVAVGVVDKIEPQPTSSKVTFSVDKQYSVPADARAAILSPSRQRLAASAEFRSLFGLRVSHVGVVYDLDGDAIIGRLAEGKRNSNGWVTR